MPDIELADHWSIEEPTEDDLAPEGAPHRDCDGVQQLDTVDTLDFGGEAF